MFVNFAYLSVLLVDTYSSNLKGSVNWVKSSNLALSPKCSLETVNTV